MFYHGYDSYLRHAFPEDELNPLACVGRGPDRLRPDNININDVLGDYALTLVDSLDSLVVLGNATEFHRAVAAVIAHLPRGFALDVQVSVFEVTIRVLGGLLSAHLLATDTDPAFAAYRPPRYQGQLLTLAADLGERLLPAFEGTATGLPFPRIHLMRGLLPTVIAETCTAGAGTLTLEFGVLSRLTGDARFETVAKRAVMALWDRRSVLGLVGNVINVHTGQWIGQESGVGAGIDSFFEYLFKGYVVLGDVAYLEMFLEAMAAVRRHVRASNGYAYRNVNLGSGGAVSAWVDSLAAYLPGLLVQAGDVDEAVRLHETYYGIWRRFGALPERFDVNHHKAVVSVYPLRPELAESTYFLYRATRDPYYLAVGEVLVRDLQRNARVPCGFATVHDVTAPLRGVGAGNHEDRMESFFLSETLKYLYLLFDEDHVLNGGDTRYVFSTEGHLLRAPPRRRNLMGSRRPSVATLVTLADVLPVSLLSLTCPNVLLAGRAAWATYGSLGLRGEHHQPLRQLVGWPHGIPVPSYQAGPAGLPVQPALIEPVPAPGPSAVAPMPAANPAGGVCPPAAPAATSASTAPPQSPPPPPVPSGGLRLLLSDPSGLAAVTVDGVYHGMRMTTNGGVQLQLAALPGHNDDWPDFRGPSRHCPARFPSQHPLTDRRAQQCAAFLHVRVPMEAPGLQILRINGVLVPEAHSVEIVRVLLDDPAVVAPVAVAAYAFPSSATATTVAFTAFSVGAVVGWSALFTPRIAGPVPDRRRASGYAVVRLHNDGCRPWTANAGGEDEPLANRVLVVRRGGCMFADKVRHAQAAGAAALVVANNDDTVILMAADRPPVCANDDGGDVGDNVVGEREADQSCGLEDANGEGAPACTDAGPEADQQAACASRHLDERDETFTIPAVMVPASAGRWLERAEASQRAQGRHLFLLLTAAGAVQQPTL